jgi:DNA polymerase III subunit beta
MKIEIIKEKFLEAITQSERVAGKHVSLPILSFVIIEAKGASVMVKATNLDVGVEVSVQAKILEEGAVAVSGSLMKSFLSNSPVSKTITIENVGSVCTIISGQSEASFNTMSVEDFPVIPKVTDGKSFHIGSKEFVTGLKSVVWSSAVSTIKPELSSVYIYEENEDLVFVATDSFRLAERKIKVKKITGFDPILIPFKNALEIVRTFENTNNEIELIISKNQLSITTEDIHLSSRVVDGNFPDYRQIIPKEFSTKATVLKADLMSALKLSSLFSNSFNQLTISFNSANKSLELSTKNNDVGEGKQSIKGVVEGDDLTMSFNHRYILDCLSVIESDSVVLKIAGQGKPMIINPSNNTLFTYLVMSMNR